MIRRVALLISLALATTSCAVLGITFSSCSGTTVIANFEQVGDLVEAANVQSSDVSIGTIEKIELDKQNWEARVTMCLNEGENIPRDSEAVVRTTSLLGEKFVDFQPHTQDGPYLQDGDILTVEETSKASELEDVFAELSTILASGQLSEINRFTAAQARILKGNESELREVLSRLSRFTEVLASRKGDIAAGIDSLDDVARTALNNQSILKRFLDSFGEASAVLADEKENLQLLLASLEQFTDVGIRLLDATDEGLTDQFANLRPVLRTVVANSANLRKGLRTFATFSDWFPETMPGDYLQLDVCQALETHTQGTTCPQSVKNDDPSGAESEEDPSNSDEPASIDEDLLEIYQIPLRGEN
ncbi:MAG: MCE family protein [Actinomycetota bacterium]|nr:MCE family protein [Actinomycetota bacterium]